MRFKILKEQTAYSGKELRSGWVEEKTGIVGDAAVGFVGPCHVATEDLVDLDDARAGTYIHSASMAHVIVEHHRCTLDLGVARQRLLVVLLCEVLRDGDRAVRRDGDDVYYGDRKLTVSIAAPAPESTVIHFGINIDPDGAPVPAIGLDEMGVEPRALLEKLLERYVGEIQACEYAASKVRQAP